MHVSYLLWSTFRCEHCRGVDVMCSKWLAYYILRAMYMTHMYMTHTYMTHMYMTHMYMTHMYMTHMPFTHCDDGQSVIIALATMTRRFHIGTKGLQHGSIWALHPQPKLSASK